MTAPDRICAPTTEPFSTTTTLRSGSSCFSRIAADRPAGLSAAIRLKQLDPVRSVGVVETGSAVGAHVLSGAVIDPSGLNALLPDWRRGPEQPLTAEVTEDRVRRPGP